jgi:stage V sporulation protein R
MLARLYAFDRDHDDHRKIRVSSREADAVRELLIPLHSSFGIPHIEIVDADFRGRGELLLEHRAESIGLDREYALGTLTQIAMLWGKPCTVKTIEARGTEKAIWYTGYPDGHSDHSAHVPA